MRRMISAPQEAKNYQEDFIMVESDKLVENRETFGEYVRRIRSSKNMCLKTLSYAAGLSYSCVRDIENGTASSPSEDTVYFIAKTLGLCENKMLQLAGRTDSILYRHEEGMEFCVYLKRTMLDKRITASEISKKINISNSQISRIARGVAKNPNKATILKILDALGESDESIVGRFLK